MDRLRLRPYEPGDFDRFTPRADFAAEHEAMGWPLRGRALPPGPTWTVVRGKEVAGCGGFWFPTASRPCQAWACLGPIGRREWPQLLALAQRVLDRTHRRVRADARISEDGSAERCLERLGFRPVTTFLDERLPGVGYRAMIRGL